MKKGHYIFFGVLFVILIAVLTNPKIDQHKDAVKLKLNSFSQKNGGLITSLFVGTIGSPMIDNMVTCDNYLIFSITKVNYNGTSKSIGFGIFGSVYLSKEIEKGIEKNFSNEKKNTNEDSYLDDFILYAEGDRTGVLEKISSNNKNPLKYLGSIIIIFDDGLQTERFEFNLVSESLKIKLEENVEKLVKLKYKEYVKDDETVYLVTELVDNN